MYLAVKDVKPQDDYKLLLTFANDEVKLFDVSKYLQIGKFKELQDKTLFKSVRVHFDSIEWANKLDLDPELLYNKSTKVFGIIPNWKLKDDKKEYVLSKQLLRSGTSIGANINESQEAQSKNDFIEILKLLTTIIKSTKSNLKKNNEK